MTASHEPVQMECVTNFRHDLGRNLKFFYYSEHYDKTKLFCVDEIVAICQFLFLDNLSFHEINVHKPGQYCIAAFSCRFFVYRPLYCDELS